MKGVKLRKIFVSIISTITIMTGALLGSWSGKANLSFAAVNTENRDNIIRRQRRDNDKPRHRDAGETVGRRKGPTD